MESEIRKNIDLVKEFQANAGRFGIDPAALGQSFTDHISEDTSRTWEVVGFNPTAHECPVICKDHASGTSAGFRVKAIAKHFPLPISTRFGITPGDWGIEEGTDLLVVSHISRPGRPGDEVIVASTSDADLQTVKVLAAVPELLAVVSALIYENDPDIYNLDHGDNIQEAINRAWVALKKIGVE